MGSGEAGCAGAGGLGVRWRASGAMNRAPIRAGAMNCAPTDGLGRGAVGAATRAAEGAVGAVSVRGNAGGAATCGVSRGGVRNSRTRAPAATPRPKSPGTSAERREAAGCARVPCSRWRASAAGAGVGQRASASRRAMSASYSPRHGAQSARCAFTDSASAAGNRSSASRLTWRLKRAQGGGITRTPPSTGARRPDGACRERDAGGLRSTAPSTP